MDLVYFYRFIPVFLFLHPFFIALRKKNKIAILICGLYLTSSIGSLFVSPEYLQWHDFETDTFFGFFLYGLFNLPLLYFSLKIEPFRFVDRIELDLLTKFFLGFLSIGALYSIVYQIPYVVKAMSMSAYDVRTMGESILPSSIFTTIAVGFPMFLFIYVFYFYLSVVKGWSLIVKILMFTGAVNFVLNVLTVSGRDGFLFFIFAFIFGYYLFENFLTESHKFYIKFIGIIVLFSGILIVSIITLDRFSRITGISINFVFQVGILNYFSMQPFTFNDILKYQDTFSQGKDIFPFFYSLFMDIGEQERDLSMPYMWNFAGYVGSFFMSGGFSFFFLILLIFYFIFSGLKNLHNKFYLYSFTILSLYLFFMTSGLFYFRMGNKGGNLFILFSVFMMFLFRYRFKIKKENKQVF